MGAGPRKRSGGQETGEPALVVPRHHKNEDETFVFSRSVGRSES